MSTKKLQEVERLVVVSFCHTDKFTFMTCQKQGIELRHSAIVMEFSCSDTIPWHLIREILFSLMQMSTCKQILSFERQTSITFLYPWFTFILDTFYFSHARSLEISSSNITRHWEQYDSSWVHI